jgi:hypothetical protein
VIFVQWRIISVLKWGHSKYAFILIIMIYSALEKKKRPDSSGTENNPEITKHNETNTANGNHKRALTYAADAAWPVNGSYLPTLTLKNGLD